MRPNSLTLVALVAVAASGCVRASDIDIRHPLVARAVDPNQIVKPHGFAEQQRGIPPGSLSDLAVLTELSEQRICFDATVRELSPVDLSSGMSTISTPGYESVGGAQVQADPPQITPYNGLVPIRVQVGMGRVCTARTYNGYCLAWAFRPIYGTRFVPGRVDVYATHARMCFGNNGAVTPKTEQIRLEANAMAKKVVFRWGLVGGGK
jgi:hypothetical protein